jgi:hypothetical protein
MALIFILDIFKQNLIRYYIINFNMILYNKVKIKLITEI